MMLTAEHVTLRAGGQDILRDVSLTFPKGEITAILGPNGAGKSTLLRALAGLLPVAEGQISVDGEPIASIPRKRLAKKLAVLPQRLSAPADMTVSQLVACGRFPYHGILDRGDSHADREAIREAMHAAGVEGLAGRQVQSLSGGESQRVWLAMTLAQEPDILLLDEPTTYLDIAHQIGVMQIIRRINEDRGTTILLVLHDIRQAADFASHIAVIDRHGLMAWGTPEETITPKLLREVFGVTSEVFRSADGREVLLPTGLWNEIPG